MSGNVHKALTVFQFRDLQTFCTILLTLQQKDLEIEDLIKYVNERKAHPIEEYQPGAITTRRDPDEYGRGRNCQKRRISTKTHACMTQGCGMAMHEFEVNTRPCNVIEENLDYKSQWICPKCDREDFE